MPPSPDALQAVTRILERQAGQIARMDLAARKRLYPILVESRRRLLDQLVSLPIDKFGAQHYRVALARIQTGIAELERDFADGLRISAEPAFALPDTHLRQQTATFSAQFEGTVRPTSWEPALAVNDDVLLLRYPVSVRTYGTGLIQRIQGELALGIATETPWANLVRNIAGQYGILAQDYYGMNSAESHRQSRAERIVRTELSWAYNRAHHANLEAANQADPGYQKTLWSTFDDRTGNDSKFVHKQVRELDELFRDNKGREYAHPPNRPNDREVEIPTREEWRDAGLPVGGKSPEPTLTKSPASSGNADIDGASRRWLGSLSDDERAALSAYTDGDGNYREMRALQRNPEQAASERQKELLHQIRLTTGAIARAPKYEDLVFRGIKSATLLDDDGNEIPLEKGRRWSSGAIVSSSIDLEVGLDFTSPLNRQNSDGAGGPLFVIRPRNVRYIAFAAHKRFQAQKEAIFPPGAEFQIADVKQLDIRRRDGSVVNRTVVYCEEVESDVD